MIAKQYSWAVRMCDFSPSVMIFEARLKPLRAEASRLLNGAPKSYLAGPYQRGLVSRRKYVLLSSLDYADGDLFLVRVVQLCICFFEFT